MAPPPPRRRRRWWVRWFWRLFLLGVMALGVGAAVASTYIARVPIPPDQVPVQTAYVFDRNGERLAAIDNGENRQVVSFERIPRRLVNAVLAAEDRRYYEHGGIDPIGIARALYQDIRNKGRRQGGSTITQQYVKNVYVGREASLRRKVREAAIAVKLERKLTKDQILERYLNTIYFGRGAYGVQAAGQAYFGKNLADLSLAQCAYLAALIRGPESTDATRNIERAEQRRGFVLQAMVETGMITPEEQATALAEPLLGAGGVLPRKARGGSIIDEPTAGTQYFVEYVRRLVNDRYGEQALQTRGLRITTTLDLAAQRRAQRETFRNVLNKKGDPDASVVLLRHDGQLLAMVGGRDWDASKVNLAIGRAGGGSGRPAGSTFKPFALAAMVRLGYTVESAFPAPKSVEIASVDENGEPWKVTNYDGKAYPTMNLIDATRLSINTVFAQLVSNESIGARAVTETARLLGIESPLQDVDSVVLGTQNVSTLEMATAYATFANRGVRIDPSVLVKVTDAGGKELAVPKPNRRRVLAEADSDVITSVLERVVQDGTGTAAQVDGVAVAGKTGTTNDYFDAWFVGYTPKDCCVMAVWVGYASGSKPMTNVHGIRVSGGTFPAQIFGRILGPVVRGEELGSFPDVTSYDGELLGSSRRRSGSGTAPTETRVRRRRVQTGGAVADSVASADTAPIDVGVPVTVVDGTLPEASPLPAPQPEPAPEPAPTTPAPAPEPAPQPAPEPEPAQPPADPA